MMKSRENLRINRGSHSVRVNGNGEGPNWVFIAGGALLSTLIVRLGFRINHLSHHKKSNDDTPSTQENSKSGSRVCPQHSNFFCYRCNSEIETISNEPDISLPLVKFQQTNQQVNADVIWSTPNRPFEPSISSESFSESGSDIYIKREVIQKLRQQLQDEMVLEMQSQITDLRNSLSAQISRSSELEGQVDSLNRELFDSEREIQRLRKAIADHCVGYYNNNNNYYYNNNNNNDEGLEEMEMKGEEKMEMMKKEIEELKEIIHGKDFFIRSYKEQKMELCEKIRDLQVKLDSRVPNIL